MNQTMTIRGQEYTISSVDETGTKFILTSNTGEQVALGMDAALLDVYTKQVMADFDHFMDVQELENTIGQVDLYLSGNGAYKRMKELAPSITISNEVLTKRAEDFRNFYVQKYPNRVTPIVEVPEVMSVMPNVEQAVAVNVEPEGNWNVPVTNTVSNTDMMSASMPNTNEVPMQNEPMNFGEVATENPVMEEDTRNFIPIRNINVMEVTHDQKNILLFLNGKYDGYEISEDFSHARDPRTGTTYVLSVNEVGQVQMIDTNRNVARELERTSPLTETKEIFIRGLSLEELEELIKTSSNIAEVQYATDVKNGLKSEFNVDDTMLIEPAKVKQKMLQERMGFISHLTISFLVGILGGIALMIVGNSISILF